jgi:hypothetical protein
MRMTMNKNIFKTIINDSFNFYINMCKGFSVYVLFILSIILTLLL